MKNKRKILLIIYAIVLAILFVPIPKVLDDGGTVVFSALTYKIVKWNRYVDDCKTRVYKYTRMYVFDSMNKSIDELWEEEMRYFRNSIGVGAEAKPVIYLYPEEETNVKVTLDYKGDLTCTYPKYENGWEVTALPDGTLKDKNGMEYNYLYWEGVSGAQYDFSQGFCVKGEDTAKFLEEALADLGLNRKEANEFIVYWLPLMQENPYNIISFQNEVYEETAKFEITPKPDTIIRVFMAYKPSDTFVEIEEQEFTAPNREGFTVVEWGGTIN